MKPELIKFVSGTKAKASEVNENFEKILNYAETASAVVSFDIETEYKYGQWVLGQVEDEFGFYESLVDKNKGHLLSDEAYWKKVSMGGGAGLEIGDIGFTQLAIDESKGKRRYLNGSVIIQDQYPIFSERIKLSVVQNPNIACTEEEWHNEVSATGLCGKYVVDDTAGTIRLPKYPNYFIGSVADIAPVIGDGTPLITVGNTQYELMAGAVNSGGASKNRLALIADGVTGTGQPEFSSFNYGKADGSDTGLITDLSNITQPLNGSYFIQVATGSEYEETITNEIMTNIPFVLLEGQYFTAPVYNASWLQSNGSLALHPTAYNALLVEYNPNLNVGTTVDNYTKRGLSVKLDTEDYTDYDFVLNTTSQTFRCPLKIKKASGNAVVGNGMTLGLTNGTKNAGLSNSSNVQKLQADPNAYGKKVQSTNLAEGNTTGIFGVTTDPTKSGIELSDSDLFLYFYVGETLQNTNIVNVGRIEELKANKTEVDGQWVNVDYVIFSNYIFSEAGDYNYDISSILPNDGYAYECLFTCYGRTGNVNGNSISLGIKSSIITTCARLGRNQARSAATVSFAGSASIPVGVDREIICEVQDFSGPSGNCGLSLIAYRRIGTNA